MGRLTDAITVARSPDLVRTYLEDLERHPLMDPDGLKHYRFLTRRTSGPSATAAVLVDLLGFWLPGELMVAESQPGLVTLRVVTRVARIDLKFVLEGNEQATFVWLEADYKRKRLPPWRVRTRVKQWLRLEKDLKQLCERLLKALRASVEKEPGAEADAGASPVSSQEPLPIDPGREFWEV